MVIETNHAHKTQNPTNNIKLLNDSFALTLPS